MAFGRLLKRVPEPDIVRVPPQLADANASLGADGLPFVLDAREVLGTFQSKPADPGRAVLPLAGTNGKRRRELPPPSAVVRF
jgi:hypothetical protein